MKAIIVRAVGGPEQLEYVDWPDPVLAAGDVLIEVKAAACNRADIWLRQGRLGALPMVPGIDAAGVVIDKASDVPGLPNGTRVLLNPAITCDACEYCYAGEHGICRQRTALGQFRDGSFAQYVKIPWRNVHPIRDDLSFEEAAAIPSAFFTAWQLLTSRGNVTAGDAVLVMAAGSGVGTAAVQIAKLLGAHVVATAGSGAKLDRARELGADVCINYSTHNDWVQAIRDATDGKGPNVILDTVGSAYWGDYMRCLRPGGRIIAFSFTAGQHPQVDIDTMVRNQYSIIASSPQGAKGICERVVELVNQGRLRGVVDRVFPLKEAAAAQTAMEDRGVIGKVVLVPD